MNEQEEREAIAEIIRRCQPFVDERMAEHRKTLEAFVAQTAGTIFHNLSLAHDEGRLEAFQQCIAVCRSYGAHDVAEALEKAKPTNVPKGGG